MLKVIIIFYSIRQKIKEFPKKKQDLLSNEEEIKEITAILTFLEKQRKNKKG